MSSKSSFPQPIPYKNFVFSSKPCYYQWTWQPSQFQDYRFVYSLSLSAGIGWGQSLVQNSDSEQTLGAQCSQYSNGVYSHFTISLYTFYVFVFRWYLILIHCLKMGLSYFKWFGYTFFLCVYFWLWGRHPKLKPLNSGCYLISNWISWKNYYLGTCYSNVWLTAIMYNWVQQLP